ncbi:hypothetical protein [Niallia nealsonii]|uniref:Flagellar hook-length control protein-like C-terminal domain-containing protein n=1 Tax=Niallia nealsonii TaxID=115979 RepID=A0A2N0Z6N8_9BACI|nr:hypothetical protein [Niallia nealsonii]PKG25186.1 hypothetical protein CWS01_02685 [Niallia nealsonii]
MNYSTNIVSFFKQELPVNQPLSLRQGQIIFGKINKIFPNQMAEVQIGQQKLLAELSIPLSVDSNYWFQVQKGDKKPQLKVLTTMKTAANTQQNQIESLLEQLSLPKTTETRAVIASFVHNKLPLTSEILEQAASWLKNSKELKQDIEIIKQMADKELPFTKEVFASLSAVQSGKSFPKLLELLQDELTVHSVKNAPLMELLATVNGREPLNLEDSREIKNFLSQILRNLGFSYEAELAGHLTSNTEIKEDVQQLKPLLLDLLKADISPSIKEAAQQLVDKITGLQLLSQEVGPVTQLVMQLPFSFREHEMEASLQFTGRKTKDGKIDSDFCRILFYLDLQHIKETAIDMKIQNRVMNVTIMNNQPLLFKLVEMFTKELKEKMQEANYTLLSIACKPFGDKNQDGKSSHAAYQLGYSSYKGVDIKI